MAHLKTFPSNKQAWAELGLHKQFSLKSLLSPFKKGHGPSNEQTSILAFTNGCFVPSLDEIWPSGSGEYF